MSGHNELILLLRSRRAQANKAAAVDNILVAIAFDNLSVGSEEYNNQLGIAGWLFKVEASEINAGVRDVMDSLDLTYD